VVHYCLETTLLILSAEEHLEICAILGYYAA